MVEKYVKKPKVKLNHKKEKKIFLYQLKFTFWSPLRSPIQVLTWLDAAASWPTKLPFRILSNIAITTFWLYLH